MSDATATGQTLPDMADEARRLVDGARERGVTIRLLGGLAARMHCAVLLFCLRDYSDIDAVGLSAQRTQIVETFRALGYEPHRMFNALHGDRRLQFYDPQHERHVDVFLDRFAMDHTIDLRHRLDLDPYTIPLADIVLTKLQVERLNAKDVRDILTLFKDAEVGTADRAGVINLAYIAALCAQDWGLHHSVSRNIANIARYIGDYELDDADRARVLERLQRLRALMESAPKSLRWRLRALLGERARWYEMPEGQG